LAEVMAQMAKDPEIQKRMSDFGSIAVANTPAEFAQMLREETDQWAKALSAIGLKR
jgi:tripartite-type tricarboxylate transporter receptor subunit TctC